MVVKESFEHFALTMIAIVVFVMLLFVAFIVISDCCFGTNMMQRKYVPIYELGRTGNVFIIID